MEVLKRILMMGQNPVVTLLAGVLIGFGLGKL